MNTMTQQDLLTVTEGARDKIIERLVTKYDVQSACDNAIERIIGSIQSYQSDNQALIRQATAGRDQEWRKLSALEGQVVSLQQEIRVLQRMISRLSERSLVS